VDFCEHGKETSGCITGREFLYYLKWSSPPDQPAPLYLQRQIHRFLIPLSRSLLLPLIVRVTNIYLIEIDFWLFGQSCCVQYSVKATKVPEKRTTLFPNHSQHKIYLYFKRKGYSKAEYISPSLQMLMVWNYFAHSVGRDWLRAGRQKGRSSRPGRANNSLFFVLSRPALGPTQPPTQWVPGSISPGVKRQRREANHSPPISAEIKKTLVCTSTTPCVFLPQFLIS
jgi:hypothetical protein